MPEIEPSAKSVSPDLARMTAAQSLREFHHRALWEEERHFSWLVSVIFSACVVAFASDRLAGDEKALVILAAASVGVIFSLVALKVVRNESDNFQRALQRFIAEHNVCFPDCVLKPVSGESVNKPLTRLLVAALRGKLSIRDAFQLLLVLFLLIFIAILSFAARVYFVGLS